jgi:ferric-dicitrate binding protein FerR (iron transport regulator)
MTDPMLDEFARETAADREAVSRIHSRLRARRRRPTLVYASLALAAAALLAIGAVRTLRPAPEAPPMPLDAELASPDGWTELAASGDVALRFAGHGHLSGTAAAPRIAWSAGTLGVEVTPDHGIDLRVETREGVVRVVGTGFTVGRDALGTTVAVSHGRVEVDCIGADAVFLLAGETATCGPTSAAGRLAKARALRDRGAADADVLAAVDDGLALDPPAPVASELRFLALEVLASAGRVDEARAMGARVVEGGDSSRSADVAAILASLSDRSMPVPAP